VSRKLQAPETDLLGVIPAWGPIETWCWVAGMSRKRTYELLGLGHLRAKRLGGRTIIDIRGGMQYMQSLPDVLIHAPAPRQSEVEAA
jgi:hypothetical protein